LKRAFRGFVKMPGLLAPCRFPPPSTVQETDGCYIVRDASGFELADVYFEEDPARRTAEGLLTREAARWLADNIAKLPDLLPK
jgi:hypothetical protein